MIIAIVTEFPADAKFQWRAAWSEEMQQKLGVMVKSVCIAPETIFWYDNSSINWYWLRRADVIFCYASRTGLDKWAGNEKWKWFNVPIHAKRFTKPDAKMIIQFDDDLIFVHDPTYVWWKDDPSEGLSPDTFFKKYPILDIGDVYCHVVEKPKFAPYCKKPLVYLPLPQTVRHIEWFDSNHKGNLVALIRHTSRAANVTHIVKNVTKDMPICYFQVNYVYSEDSGIHATLPIGSKTYPSLDPHIFMNTLHETCRYAIDDAEGYIGWSRFVMECAIAGIPCIGSNNANRLIFPDLCTEHKDYDKQRELLERLKIDKEFYESCLAKGRDYIKKELDPEFLCRRLLELARSLNPPDTPVPEGMVLKESLINILERGLPFHVIPLRPAIGQEVWDYFSNQNLNHDSWFGIYGKYEKFISDPALYREIIVEVLERKNQLRKDQQI
jgi:hypothetical protein